jgi:hypothetical protein
MIGEELGTTISQTASAALLRIGGYYQEAGWLHQALLPYLKILACYPEGREASEAVDRLVAIAELFEERGQFRMAMSVYDRMERAVVGAIRESPVREGRLQEPPLQEPPLQRWDRPERPPEGHVVDRRLQGTVPERRSVPFPPPTGNGGLKEEIP